MKNKTLIIFVIFSLLFLPYVRRVYLINIYPNGIPHESTTVFIIVFAFITLFQLKNRYYPPKITIFQRLMTNTMFYEVVMFLYKGLQANYHKPLKEFNTYMLRFNFYIFVRKKVANVYTMKNRFNWKTFKVSEFISYIAILYMPLMILIIYVIYPYLVFNIYNIKGLCLFSSYSMYTSLSKIWYYQLNQEKEEQIKLLKKLAASIQELLLSEKAKLKTLDELQTLLNKTEDEELLETYTLEYNHLIFEYNEMVKHRHRLHLEMDTLIKHAEDD
jgi:hypothetical protein